LQLNCFSVCASSCCARVALIFIGF
jgi:hypothetical protein